MENLPIPLSISVGYAVRKNLDNSIKELCEKAEYNMYRKKTLESKAVKNEIMEHIIKKTRSYKINSREFQQTVRYLSLKLGRELQLREIEMDKLKRRCSFIISVIRRNPRIFSQDAMMTR